MWWGKIWRDENGELNYRDMITDFYSATDNHNSEKILWWKHDEIDEMEDNGSKIDGHGLGRDSTEYRYEMYMKEHGIDVDVHNVTMKNPTPETYQEQHEKGDIIMFMRDPVLLYNEDGSEAFSQDNAGHVMTVTGVTDDGLIIVSSWGRKFYVNPQCDSTISYQQVTYK